MTTNVGSIGMNSGNIPQPPANFIAKLTAAGIPSSVISQGPQAVMQYAQANNITLPTPPSPPQGQQGQQGGSVFDGQNRPDPSQMKAQIESKLESLGIPSSVIQQGLQAVQQYAQQNNISLPAPPSRGQNFNQLA